MLLLPRLPRPAAEILLEQHISRGFSTWSGFDSNDLPAAVCYAATGGSQVPPRQLLELRERLLRIARSHGLGESRVQDSHAAFDSEVASSLAEDQLFQSGEALRDDVWTFVGTSLAPDIVHWRFGPARERYLGGVRNTFQRLWMRGIVLDRGSGHNERWQLLELSEDALVQLIERPSLGGDPILGRSIAEAWLRASLHHGRSAMEPIMRRGILRIRIWNELRSLSSLPSADLAGVLDRAFDLPKEREPAAPHRARQRPAKPPGTVHSQPSKKEQPEPQRVQEPAEPTNADHTLRLAAMRVRDEAIERRLISPKSSKALDAVEQGQGNLTSSQRNALKHLLSRLQSAAALPEEVSQLLRVAAS